MFWVLVWEELAKSQSGRGGLEVWGLVAPFLHHRLLHLKKSQHECLLQNAISHLLGVCLGVDTDLLGNLDAVRLLDKPRQDNNLNPWKQTNKQTWAPGQSPSCSPPLAPGRTARWECSEPADGSLHGKSERMLLAKSEGYGQKADWPSHSSGTHSYQGRISPWASFYRRSRGSPSSPTSFPEYTERAKYSEIVEGVNDVWWLDAPIPLVHTYCT